MIPNTPLRLRLSDSDPTPYTKTLRCLESPLRYDDPRSDETHRSINSSVILGTKGKGDYCATDATDGGRTRILTDGTGREKERVRERLCVCRDRGLLVRDTSMLGN